MYTCSRIHSHPSYKYFPQAWVVVEGVEGKKRWVSKYANLIHFNKVYTTVWAKCHVAHRKERRWRQGRVWERLKRTYILQRSWRLSSITGRGDSVPSVSWKYERKGEEIWLKLHCENKLASVYEGLVACPTGNSKLMKYRGCTHMCDITGGIIWRDDFK